MFKNKTSFCRSSNLVPLGQRVCGVFELWAAFPRGPTEKCLNSNRWGDAKAVCPWKDKKKIPCKVTTIISAWWLCQSHSCINSKSICGRIFLKHEFMFCFLQFSLFPISSRARPFVFLCLGDFTKWKKELAGDFTAFCTNLKVVRDDIRRSGDAEMPESYSGSISKKGKHVPQNKKKKKREGGWVGGERELSVKGDPERRLVVQDSSLSK